MSEFMGELRRTAYCGTLRKEDVGKEVVVMGWTQRRRNLGALLFVDLRDKTGLVQVVFDDTTDSEVFDKAQAIRSEYVLAVKGKVRERESKTNKIATGDIEILADELKILSEADTTPFEILDDTNVNETLRLKYRYLDLRRPFNCFLLINLLVITHMVLFADRLCRKISSSVTRLPKRRENSSTKTGLPKSKRLCSAGLPPRARETISFRREFTRVASTPSRSRRNSISNSL